MAILRVNPTRMELTRIKRRLVTARRGHKLLKDKRDEMVRRFIALIRENHRLRGEVEKELGSALSGFAMARAVVEPAFMEEEALLSPRPQHCGGYEDRSILSVRVPQLTTKEEDTQNT